MVRILNKTEISKLRYHEICLLRHNLNLNWLYGRAKRQYIYKMCKPVQLFDDILPVVE